MTADNEKLELVVKRLKNELQESKKRADQEIVKVQKNLESEIKEWRKELGEERKLKIKLEEELSKSKVENFDQSTQQNNRISNEHHFPQHLHHGHHQSEPQHQE